MAEVKITTCGDQSELRVKEEVKITPCGDQSELRVKEEVKIISIEEKGSRKKRRQNRKRRKKVAEGEADARKTEEGITPDPPTPASNTQKSDSPEENRARKRKRTRRKNRNKKTQEVIEGELTGDKETTCCPSLHVETQTNSVKSELNSEKETSMCPSLHDETQPNSVKSSTTASRKRANRRKKNKWKTAEADRVVQLQSSDLINAVDIKVEVAKSGEGCLNVTNVEERKAQENGEVQRRRKRPRNRRKATVSEDHGKFLQPCGTVANTLLTGENGQPAVVSGQPAVVSGQLAVVSGQPAVVSGQATVTNKKKRRNRKRKRSQSVPGDSTMNTSLTKKLTLVVKEDKVREDGESVPHQNTETESSTNQKKKKKRQRNKRRKQHDKDEDKKEIKIGIDLTDDSHESGVEIINGTDNTNNRKRNLAVDAENLDNKKMKLGDIEETGTNSVVFSSLQSQQQGNKEPGKKKRRRKRKKKHIESVGGSCQDLSSIMAVTDENKDVVSSSPGDGESQPVSKQSNSPPYKKLTKEKTVLKSWSSDVSVCVCAEINPLYNEESTREKINKHWSDGEGHLCKGSGLEVIQDPFTCCFLPNFLKEADFLEGVRDELQDIELVMNNNDLYKFRQTSNLNDVNSPHIAALRNFLYGDFRRWLVDVTGLPLNDNVYMTSSRYEYTDVLLCHDDELEGRRIAFILYLVPQWLEEDGGSLDLFSVDDYGQPKDVVRCVKPQWNSFAFFEVSPVSFHQVAEVLSRDKVRHSINGWFHGPNIERPPKYITPSRAFDVPVHIEEDELYSWINPTYLDMDVQREIRHKFRTDSEVELESFLAENKYQELAEALKSSDLIWQCTGPANKQNFEVLKLDKVPDIINSCLNFLRSEAVFLVVSQLTGLKLHKLAPPDSEPDSDEEDGKESCPRVSIDIRQWRHGCYTLLRDDNLEDRCSLDANLFVNISDKWSQEYGGFISYIAKDEDTELLTVVPRPNRFALVYRDAETLRFTKHINASVCELGERDSSYNNFACVYYE